MKNVYFQNEEGDEEEIQTLDEGSTFITRLRIKGFDFHKNVQCTNMNLSALLFFHEIPNNGWMIKQPIVPIDKDKFSSSYEQNDMKMDTSSSTIEVDELLSLQMDALMEPLSSNI